MKTLFINYKVKPSLKDKESPFDSWQKGNLGIKSSELKDTGKEVRSLIFLFNPKKIPVLIAKCTSALQNFAQRQWTYGNIILEDYYKIMYK